jgi:signal transduction histidine kinase
MKHFFFIVFIFISVWVYPQRSAQDSVNTILQHSSDEEKLPVLQNLIVTLWLNHPDSAMLYARQAMTLAIAMKNTKYMAIAHRLMGGVHSYKGDYDSSLFYNRRGFTLSLASGDSTLISSSTNNLGLVYYHLGDYPKALENLLHALDIKYAIHQDYGLGQTLNNLGLVYTKLKDYTKAREYFNEALKVSARLKDKNIELYSLNNIGFTYLYEHELEKSETYFNKSLEVAKWIDNTNWHATAYSGLAQVYFEMDRIAQAKTLFKTSLALRNKIGDKNGISETYFFLSRIFYKTGNLDSALIVLRQSGQYVAQTGVRARKLENLELFKDIYVRKKKYDSALYYQSRFIELRDSLFNENLARNLADIQSKFQEEKTQQQLAEKDIQIEEQTMRARFLTAIVIVILFFSVVIYRYYRTQKRLSADLTRMNAEALAQKEEIETQKEALVLTNEELETAHNLIQEQNQELAALNDQLQSTVEIRTKELEIANRELKVVNLELDNFIYKSSHDIKGPLVRLLGICHVAMLDISDEKARNYLRMLNNTARHLNDIFDRLKIVSDINTLEIDRVPIKFDQVLNKVRKNVKLLDGYDQVEIVFDDGADEYYSDPFLIETIFHNMIENAVRFQKKSTQENKFIRIETKREEQDLVISFIDNGIGIKENDVDHIFKMFSQAALEHNTVGLGLYIVKQCVNKLNGSVTIVSSDQKFTEFQVVLPA